MINLGYITGKFISGEDHTTTGGKNFFRALFQVSSNPNSDKIVIHQITVWSTTLIEKIKATAETKCEYTVKYKITGYSRDYLSKSGENRVMHTTSLSAVEINPYSGGGDVETYINDTKGIVKLQEVAKKVVDTQKAEIEAKKLQEEKELNDEFDLR